MSARRAGAAAVAVAVAVVVGGLAAAGCEGCSVGEGRAGASQPREAKRASIAAAPFTASASGRYFLVGKSGARSFVEPGQAAGAAPLAGIDLAPGFGMAIVEERFNGGRRLGRTGAGRWLAMSDLVPARAATLSGVDLTAAGRPDPLGFAWVVTAGAPVLAEAAVADGRVIGRRPLFAREPLGAPCAAGARLCAVAGGWMRRRDLRVPAPGPRPVVVGPAERWIDVDLAAQVLVAHEGDRPVFATLVSTGIGAPGSRLATPVGVFRIRSKHLTASMDNLEHTGVVPYSYEDIPLVQYFTDRVALHAALWHQRFGHPASHGCINLTPADAERLFAFTTPRLPTGRPDIHAPGTVIRIRPAPR